MAANFSASRAPRLCQSTIRKTPFRYSPRFFPSCCQSKLSIAALMLPSTVLMPSAVPVPSFVQSSPFRKLLTFVPSCAESPIQSHAFTAPSIVLYSASLIDAGSSVPKNPVSSWRMIAHFAVSSTPTFSQFMLSTIPFIIDARSDPSALQLNCFINVARKVNAPFSPLPSFCPTPFQSTDATIRLSSVARVVAAASQSPALI